VGLTVLALAGGGVAGTGGAATGHAAKRRLSNCFWLGPAIPSRPGFNYAFPDAKAAYWSARFQLPQGARIVLQGRFAHARYQSLNSYGSNAAPTDAVNDVHTRPDSGSRNPFRAGARRDVRRRAYTVSIVGLPPPASRGDRRPNTLYAGVPGQSEQRLLYRVYVPDRGRDVTGDVGLPRLSVRLADGRVVSGRAACTAIGALHERLPLTTLPRSIYDSLRDQPDKPPTFPADNPPVFQAFYNITFSIACGYQGACGGRPPRTGGQYSNIDNSYVSGFVSRGFGRVLVLRGKLPATPHTRAGERRMGRGQLRYWSLCQNESLLTTRGAGCLYDEQIPLDRRGFYTIVTSRRGDRPRNAVRRCGVAFLPWPPRGDGAGHRDDGLLILRNMLPARGFKHAIQRTRVPGDEPRVMGPYLPRGKYMSKRRFESRGCRR
jgi:hypothetical protein